MEVNNILNDAPDLVIESPYEKGWMIKIKLNDASELDNLMTMSEYDNFVIQSEGN